MTAKTKTGFGRLTNPPERREPPDAISQSIRKSIIDDASRAARLNQSREPGYLPGSDAEQLWLRTYDAEKSRASRVDEIPSAKPPRFGNGLVDLDKPDAEVAEFREGFEVNEKNLGLDRDIDTPAKAIADSVRSGELLAAIASIRPSPKNPRKTFDPVELARLAKSIEKEGVLQALLVRPAVNGVYELVAGERRLRAAMMAGLTLVPIRVKEFSDRDVAMARLVENLDREDLNALDEAQAFQDAIDGLGFTQAELAERLGISAPQISNRLRLLQLPQEFKELVVSGWLPATQARSILPYIDLKPVMTQLHKKLNPANAVPSVKEFDQMLAEQLERNSRSMGEGYPYPKFKPTPEQKEQLDIRDVPKWYGGSHKRAFNVKLWDKLQKAAEPPPPKAKPAGTQTSGKSGKSGKAAAAPKETFDARKFGDQLFEARMRWYGERILAKWKQLPLLATLLVLVDSSEGDLEWRIKESLLKKGQSLDEPQYFGLLLGKTDAQLSACVQDVLRKDLAKGTCGMESGLLALAARLKIALVKEWKPTLDFLAAWPLKALQDLVPRMLPASKLKDDSGWELDDTAKGLASWVLSRWPAGFIPPEFLTADDTGRYQTTLQKKKTK
jgi:ParB family chromosome partitioning protein